MLTSKQLMRKIDAIVDQSYLGFMFMILGDDFFTDEQKRSVEALGLIVGNRPLIELLYILIRQRSTPGYLKDVTLQELLDQIAQSGVLPVINDANRYTVDHAKSELMETMEDAKNELKKKIKQEILKENSSYKDDLAVARITTIPDLQAKKESYLNKMLMGIGALAIASNSKFVASFVTAFTNFVNSAAVDSATVEQLFAKIKGDPEVYKTVINDADLCSWCAKFYRNRDGSPKLFRLSELTANGSNYGKPKSEWRPTVAATHPRCRCQLHYL